VVILELLVMVAASVMLELIVVVAATDRRLVKHKLIVTISDYFLGKVSLRTSPPRHWLSKAPSSTPVWAPSVMDYMTGSLAASVMHIVLVKLPPTPRSTTSSPTTLT
jgi:hypothetical protein